ncbi:MAG: pilus assembly protein PilM, partial [Candidatus Omnitrophica bacterium]|nr:pilus assembly protein PilM [Candidatus Omnitrophota bacterium]
MSNVFGLYAGIDFVDLVVMGGQKERLKIIKSVRTFLYDEAAPPEEKDKAGYLPAAVKKAVSSAALRVGPVNFCLPQNEIMVRHFKMPYLPEAERQHAVRFEAQKYIPFKADDTISDFYIMEESPQDRFMVAFFAAVNKAVVEKSMSALTGSGLRLHIADIIPLTLLRLLAYCKKLDAEESTVVIYAERDQRATVIIAKDEAVYLAREVSPSASRTAFYENVLNNIKLSVDYYKRETKEVVLKRILICGEADALNLQAYLKENIETTPVEIFSFDNEIEGLSDLSRKQLIAIGLAMASFEKPGPKINLINPAMAAGSLTRVEQYRPVIIEGVAFFIVLMMLQFAGNYLLTQVKKKANEAKTEKAGSAAGITQEVSQDALLAMEGRMLSNAEFLRDIVGEKRLYLIKKLNCLGKFFPEGAWIESLEFTDDIDRSR